MRKVANSAGRPRAAFRARRQAQLLDNKGFTGARLPIQKQALAIYAAEKIDFVDEAVLAIARHNGWHVETFDKALGKLIG